ncbi:MAG: hypothetical protein GC154_15800 [bacterium]|nr:hypothetical protein [bacterium]
MRRWIRFDFSLLIALLAIAGLVYVFYSVQRKSGVAYHLAQLQRFDNPDAANRLARFLSRDDLPLDDRVRILEALIQPKIIQRDEYRSDRNVVVSVTHPWPIYYMGNYQLTREEGFKDAENGSTQSTSFDNSTWKLVYQPDGGIKPGVVHTTIVCQYKLYENDGTPIDDREPLHIIERKIPVMLTIRPPDEAEPIELVRNEWLDKEMEQNFKNMYSYNGVPMNTGNMNPPMSGYGGMYGGMGMGMGGYGQMAFSSGGRYSTTYTSKSGQTLEMIGQLEVQNNWISEPVAFEAVYRDSEGKEYPIRDFMYVSQQNGGFSIRPPIVYQEAGEYKGEIILRASEELAYQDPEISHIWGGEIVYPVTVTVQAATPPVTIPAGQ